MYNDAGSKTSTDPPNIGAENKDFDNDDNNSSSIDNRYKVKVLNNNKSGLKQPRVCEIGLLPNLPFSAVCIGKSGSGKSMAVCNMLSNPYMLKDVFDFIIMYTGVEPDENLIECLELPKENIKVNFTEDDVSSYMTKMEKVCKQKGKKSLEEVPKVCMIFDDILGFPKFLKSATMSKLITTNRHMNISVIILSQYFKKLPCVVRTNASYTMVFPSSEAECLKIAEELCPPNLNKKQFMTLIRHATAEPYQFLSINSRSPPQKMLRKNFDTILNM